MTGWASRTRAGAVPCRVPEGSADVGRRRLMAAGLAAAALGAWPAAGSARVAEATLRARLAKAVGGDPVIVEGRVELFAPVVLRSGVTLAGMPGAALVAGAAMPALLSIPSGATDVSVTGLTLDGAGRTGALVDGLGASTVLLEDLHCLRWRAGIRLGSRGDTAAGGLVLRRLRVESPAEGAVFPILIRSGTGGPAVRDVTIEDVVLIGSGGAYSRENAATADQLTLQGVDGFRISRVESRAGGENGITVSRLSRNGVIEDCLVAGNDGHGLNIGSGFVSVSVGERVPFREGEVVTGDGGLRAEVQRIRGRTLFLNRVVRGRLVPGDVLSGSDGRVTVATVSRTERIAVRGVTARSNWLNLNAVPGTGAGLYVQQSDGIVFLDCRSGDDRAPSQDYGLQYAQSDVGFRDCDFSGNRRGPVRATGESQRIPVPMP